MRPHGQTSEKWFWSHLAVLLKHNVDARQTQLLIWLVERQSPTLATNSLSWIWPQPKPLLSMNVCSTIQPLLIQLSCPPPCSKPLSMLPFKQTLFCVWRNDKLSQCISIKSHELSHVLMSYRCICPLVFTIPRKSTKKSFCPQRNCNNQVRRKPYLLSMYLKLYR